MDILLENPCADPEGLGTGCLNPPPMKKSFLSNTGPDPLKNHKATKPVLNVGPSSMEWRFAGGLMMAHL